MVDDLSKALNDARAVLVEERRMLVAQIATKQDVLNNAEKLETLQKAVEAVDRALHDETAIARRSVSSAEWPRTGFAPSSD